MKIVAMITALFISGIASASGLNCTGSILDLNTKAEQIQKIDLKYDLPFNADRGRMEASNLVLDVYKHVSVDILYLTITERTEDTIIYTDIAKSTTSKMVVGQTARIVSTVNGKTATINCVME